MSRRNDAYRVYDIPPYKQIFPYIMPRRCDSIVYQHLTFDMSRAVAFIKEQKIEHEKSYRVFEVFLAAMLRTIALRPHLNRFIANYRYWQRKELSLNFVVRESGDEDAPEHSMPLYFEPDMTLPEIAAIITEAIDLQRQPDSENFTDAAIRYFLRFPSPVIRLIIAGARLLDNYGKAPQALREADGLHTSLFVSNLGSIGIGVHTPLHHLYEWGTTSIFLTVGQLKRTRRSAEDGGGTKDTLEIGVAIDERITDGYYLVKSMRILQDHLLNPELLLERPTLPPLPMSKAEYRAHMRALK